MVNLTIDGVAVSVPEGSTILDASLKANVHIPTLCYLKDINAIGACRMCVVEVKGARALQAACVHPVSEGMEVRTNSRKVREARKNVLELILSDHERKCLTCVRNQSCELQKLCDELGVGDIPYEGERASYKIDDLSPSIVRDNNKCILCRRCIAVCKSVQNVAVIGAIHRGCKTEIGPAFGSSLNEVACINCGQCIANCPVGALYEKDATQEVWDALEDPNKYVVFQTAPAVRAALGEEFGLPMGTSVTGQMAAAIRRLGADKTFDTDFGADLTIMEEGTELLHRLNNNGVLPMITSCSPGWIKFCEHYYPEFLDNLSTCKSPHEMFGAVMKSFFAEKEGIDPEKIYVVSVMPCTAKKFEAQRPEMGHDGMRDVDAVLTTRELAKMIKQAGIDFASLEPEKFDEFFGDSTGAAVIFGATGGVMEAALRTVADILTGKDLPDVDYTAVRGVEGVKEAEVEIAGKKIKVAVAHSTGAASKLLDAIKDGTASGYHFIEVMGCPGGCVTGGGQPFVSARDKMKIDPRVERAKALYNEDASMPLRKSHKNPSIQRLYEEYFGQPCGHKSHELLHTHYTARPKY